MDFFLFNFLIDLLAKRTLRVEAPLRMESRTPGHKVHLFRAISEVSTENWKFFLADDAP